MAHSQHSKRKRPAKVNREGGERVTTRLALQRGDWDAMPSRMSTVHLRRPTY